MALLAGELSEWPTIDYMVALLQAAGLDVTVGRYAIRVEGHTHFVFQQYGGDVGDPLVDAEAETVSELLATATLVSKALARAGVVHRFELYDEAGGIAGYLHHRSPLLATG